MAKKQHGGKRAGAGRKVANPEGPTVTLAVTVPGALVDELNAYATEQGWNRSEAVTRAIRGLLSKRKPSR